MEDQGEWSPQTFLVNNFAFLQPQQKQDDTHQVEFFPLIIFNILAVHLLNFK